MPANDERMFVSAVCRFVRDAFTEASDVLACASVSYVASAVAVSCLSDRSAFTSVLV